MSIEDDYRAIVASLRGWGFDVREEDGCYGRSNGSSWAAGRPEGHIFHHYVCGLSPSQDYIDGLVSNLKNGTVVQWFADVNGRCYLIGTGPMNHAGTGNQSVLDLVRQDRPPPSNPAGAAGEISGNKFLSGCEGQHPGDSTPWPAPLLDVMVAIGAASFLQWGYTANRAINHSEWSNRKIDMSAGGGVNSDGWSADELRRRVAARMTGTTEGDWLDMVSKEELQAMLDPILGAANRADWGVNDTNNGVRVQVANVQNTVSDIQGRQIPLLDGRVGGVAVNVTDIQGRQIPLVDGHVLGLYPPVGADTPGDPVDSTVPQATVDAVQADTLPPA